MQRFGSKIKEMISPELHEGVVDSLIESFPVELRERLEDETLNMDLEDAVDYLINRLAERRSKLVEWGISSIPGSLEISEEVPQVFLNSIAESQKAGGSALLGSGENGKVLVSIRNPSLCYKILHNKRAQEMHANIVREIVMQKGAADLLWDVPDVAQVPQVWRFTRTEEIQAMCMDRVEGNSLDWIMKNNEVFPNGFNIDIFFQKIYKTIRILNEHGYYHRDLTNNLGNVMVDKEGNPWIIDFGSAIKGYPSPDNSNHYQLIVGQSYFTGTDQFGVKTLEAKVRDYLGLLKRQPS